MVLITDSITGEITCRNCGTGLSEKGIDYGPEQVGQTKEEYLNNARTGQKISLKMADMGLAKPKFNHKTKILQVNHFLVTTSVLFIDLEYGIEIVDLQLLSSHS